MKAFLTQFFSWWNGQTLGTRFFTWRKGEAVGEDQFGNRYFRAPSAIPDSIPERRWVIYRGYAEASTIPPGWHAWMHHRAAEPPSSAYAGHDWEAPHQPNLTGTPFAYHPPGSIVWPRPQAPVKPDYEAWRPE